MGGRGLARDGSAGILEKFRRRFGRETTSGRFIPEIDGLRFPAIAIVVLAHLCSLIMFRVGRTMPVTRAEWPIVAADRHAQEGVVLFFIISGFVLALPFARARLLGDRPVSLSAYFLRRVTRLEPPYLISLFILFVAKVGGRAVHLATDQGSTGTLTEHFLISAAYLHNLVYGTASIINGVAWSLEIEIQFYVLVPLLAAVFSLRSAAMRRTVLLATVVVAIALQQAFMAPIGRVAFSILGFLQYFMLGFLLADIYLTEPALSAPARRYAWDVVALAAWVTVLVAWTSGDAGRALVPFAAFVAFVAVFRGPITRRCFTNPIITTIGGMCYSIYLIHFWLLSNSMKLFFAHRPVASAFWPEMWHVGLPSLLITLPICGLFYLLIERPCMDRRWPRRLASWWHTKVLKSAHPAAASGAENA
jgi:peptidoglycan/LPS O-acetylase OafA/YrhL